jgi:cytidylate kinase
MGGDIMTSIDAIINRQLLRWELEKKQADVAEVQPEKTPPAPIITISRQTGSRGSYFASRLATSMSYQRLHREVIDRIAETAGYRTRIVESLDEKHRNELELMIESLFTGKSVDHYDYVKHLHRIVLSMAQLGGVILVGRGGNFILGLDRGFHIRIVAPVEKRVENLRLYRRVSTSEAEKMVSDSDKARREFAKKVFDREIDDPSGYDMTINSAYLDVEDLIDVVADAVKAKFQKLAFPEHL